MGIVSARFLPEVVLDLPGKGKVDGAIRGAGRGFVAWGLVPLRIGAEAMRSCSGQGCGYAAIGVLAVAAASGSVGAVIGGVEGAIRAMPAAEARRIEEATRHLADLNIQETVRDRVLEEAGDASGCTVLAVMDAGPTASDCTVDYGGMGEKGIRSVVEVSVLSVGFKGEKWGRNPPLSVFLKARVRRYRAGDGRMLEEKELSYRSAERQFSDWMADGAALVGEEFEAGYGELAERIANEAICPPGEGPSVRRPGSGTKVSGTRGLPEGAWKPGRTPVSPSFRRGVPGEFAPGSPGGGFPGVLRGAGGPGGVTSELPFLRGSRESATGPCPPSGIGGRADLSGTARSADPEGRIRKIAYPA